MPFAPEIVIPTINPLMKDMVKNYGAGTDIMIPLTLPSNGSMMTLSALIRVHADYIENFRRDWYGTS